VISIQLFYFLLGYASACFFIPILTTASELILTALELLKSYLNIPLVKNNEAIQAEPPVHQIGFHYSKEEEYEDEEDL
jgi:uncharacterized membrane protein